MEQTKVQRLTGLCKSYEGRILSQCAEIDNLKEENEKLVKLNDFLHSDDKGIAAYDLLLDENAKLSTKVHRLEYDVDYLKIQKNLLKKRVDEAFNDMASVTKKYNTLCFLDKLHLKENEELRDEIQRVVKKCYPLEETEYCCHKEKLATLKDEMETERKNYEDTILRLTNELNSTFVVSPKLIPSTAQNNERLYVPI